MAAGEQTVFRKKTLERISSPEQLTDYLRVINPGTWAVLAAVIVLLVGLLAWSAVGTLETTTAVKVVVEDHTAQVVSLEGETLVAGMTLRVLDDEAVLVSAQSDEYGRSMGAAALQLPDGIYDGSVVTEAVHPIKFLLESR